MTTEETVTTKENLAWFQKRRDRWKNAPRPKVVPLSPKTNLSLVATTTTTTTSNAAPSAAPVLPNKQESTQSNSTAATSTATTSSSQPTFPTFSFGAAAPAASSTHTTTSKPLFGASSTTTSSNPFTFGSTQQQSSKTASSIFGNIRLTPSTTDGNSDSTSSKATTEGTAPSATTTTVKRSAPNAGDTSAKSAFSSTGAAVVATPSSVFAGINLTPSSLNTTAANSSGTSTASQPPAPGPNFSSSSSASFGSQSKAPTDAKSTGSVFANINLVPSSGTSDKPKDQAAKAPSSLETSTPSLLPFGAANSQSSSSQAPAPFAKPVGKVRTSAAAATKNNNKTAAAPTFKTAAAPTFTAPSSKTTAGSIFTNINLTPDTSSATTTTTSSMFGSTKPLFGSSSTGPSPFSFGGSSAAPSASSSNPVPVFGGMSIMSAKKDGPSTEKESTSTTGSIFSNINLTPDTSSTGNGTSAIGSTLANKPLDHHSSGDGGTTAAVPKPTSMEASSASDSTTTTTTSSMFGSTKPLFGASSTSPSPLSFGTSSAAPSASSSSNPLPVFGGMSIMSANEDGPSSSTVDASTEVKPSTEKEPTSSDKSKIGQESSSSIAPPGSNEQQPESSSTKEEDDPKNRLIAFYQKHNPEKLNTVDSTLEKYEGKEDELFRKLEAKYMPTPVSKYQVPGGKGPTCFLEFTIDGEPAGKVTVKLFSDKVPLASDNFQALCTGSKGNGRKGKPLCYKNSKIHRVVPLFCVQMGDFTLGDGTGGESIYEPNTSGVSDSMGRFRDEEFFQHSKKGLLSMANNGADRNGSQFFFTLRPCHSLDGKHVVFGEVISGMDVVEKIGQLQTTPKQRPQQSVEITNCGEIVDGKDIPCQVTAEKAPAPFSFGAATFGSTTSGQTNSSGFGGLAASAKASSTFGFGAANSSTGSSPFSFGAVASSLQSGGGFGSSPGGTSKLSGGVASAAMPSSNPSPPGFGATGSAATSKPFGSGGTGKLPDGASVFAKPSNNPSPFSFGATGSTTSKPFGGGGPMTAFGSSSSSNPFTFGSLASQGGDLPFGGAKPTDSGPTLAFPGEPSSAPGMSYRGGEGGGGVAAEVSDSEDDDSEDDEYHKIINAR